MTRPRAPRRLRPALALSCVLSAALPAGAAQEQPPKPPAPEPAKPAAPEFVGADLIRRADGMVVKYYRTRYVAPDVLAKELEIWKTAAATLVASGQSVRPQTEPPTHQPASTSPVAKRAIEGGGAQNVLRIIETAENWPVLERMLAVLDVPQPQVRVNAKVIELLWDDQRRFGVTAKITRPVGDTFLQSIEANFPNPLDAVNGLTATFKESERFLVFDYAVEAVEQGAYAEVNSRPSILVAQGETAVLRSGDKEPFAEQNLQGNNVVATTKFEPVGVTLEVQPLFVGDGAVRVRVSAEASRVSDFRVTATSATQSVVNAVISTRKADTIVTVNSGDTIVVGGLEQKSTRDERTGIPWLKDIPYLGYLFGSTTKREQRTELFFWLTLTVERPEEARILEPGK